jgi:hypothetical protein
MGEHVTDTDSGVDLKVGVCNWGITHMHSTAPAPLTSVRREKFARAIASGMAVVDAY